MGMEKNEIVNITREGLLDIIDEKGNSWTNFPVWTPAQSASPPVPADLDNDGYKEVVALAFDSAWAWRYTGELVEGWPKAPVDTVYTQYMDRCSTLLADLNKTGNLEIIAVRGAGVPGDWPRITGAVEGFNWKGELLSGGPKQLIYAPWSGPVAGDLDKDGELE